LKEKTKTEGIEDSKAKVMIRGERTIRVEGAFG